MWNQKHDKYILTTGVSSVEINTEIDIIRAKVKVDNCLFAYLIGDFNQWKKQDCFRLDWAIDSNDGILSMMSDIAIPQDLTEGKHHYSFLLIDINGNEILLSQSNEHFVHFTFELKRKTNKLSIITSESELTRGSSVDIVAIHEVGSSFKHLANVVWNISPSDAASIHDDKLYIHENTSYNEIIISCYETDETNAISRSYKIVDATNNQPTTSKIHYYRRDNTYSGENFKWNIWEYNDEGKESKAIDFTQKSDIGMLANINQNNIIIRRESWEHGWHNDWSEQTGSFNLDLSKSNYYVVDGEMHLYTHLKEVISHINAKIELAIMDSRDKIVAYLSDTPPVGTQFYTCINQVKQPNINVIIKDKLKQVIFLDLPKSLRANDLITVHASNTFSPCKVLMRNVLHDFQYNGNDMGCNFVNNKITLRLWAPTAKSVELLIYNDDETKPENPDFNFYMYHESAHGTHYAEIPAEGFENKAYLFRLFFDELDRDNNVIVQTNYAIDPYAVSVCTNGSKGYLVDITSSATMPEDWLNDTRPPLENINDSIIYEMHIRDFSINNKDVNKDKQGKFLGLAESGKLCDDNTQVTTGLDHLTELGITHVHLLPFFDFSSVDERIDNDSSNRNWGYDPQNYNVPEGSYSSDANNPVTRILELRTAIQKFHQKGLRVVMDMVYNHMTNTVNLDKIVPKYYFRTDDRVKFTNGSGCGNELATEHPMVRKFVLDSIRHWVNNYHIDGTRFDLMELMDFDTTLQIVETVKQIDKSIIVYGEPWKGGHSPLNNGTYRGRQKNNQFAIFNDLFRDATRGSNEPSRGFANNDQYNSKNLWNVIEGLKGSINTMSATPAETINYVDAHDNYTLWDQIERSQSSILDGHFRENLPHNLFDSILVKQNILALSIILTAQGIPFFQGGAEFMRTKQGDHNSYKSNDSVNQFYWEDKLKHKEFYDYIRGLIELRNTHPAFRMSNPELIHRHLTIVPANNNDTSGIIIAHFREHANNDIWKNIVVIYNASSCDNYDINPLLPEIELHHNWSIVANDKVAGIKPISIHKPNILPAISAYSICILHDTIESL